MKNIFLVSNFEIFLPFLVFWWCPGSVLSGPMDQPRPGSIITNSSNFLIEEKTAATRGALPFFLWSYIENCHTASGGGLSDVIFLALKGPETSRNAKKSFPIVRGVFRLLWRPNCWKYYTKCFQLFKRENPNMGGDLESGKVTDNDNPFMKVAIRVRSSF